MIQCRICLEENLERNDVIVPCKCSGTQKYVHKRCLNEWRTINRNNRLYHKCQLCNTEYSLMIIGGLNYVPAYEGIYVIDILVVYYIIHFAILSFLCLLFK
jgi:hypothetical protein